MVSQIYCSLDEKTYITSVQYLYQKQNLNIDTLIIRHGHRGTDDDKWMAPTHTKQLTVSSWKIFEIIWHCEDTRMNKLWSEWYTYPALHSEVETIATCVDSKIIPTSVIRAVALNDAKVICISILPKNRPLCESYQKEQFYEVLIF